MCERGLCAHIGKTLRDFRHRNVHGSVIFFVCYTVCCVECKKTPWISNTYSCMCLCLCLWSAMLCAGNFKFTVLVRVAILMLSHFKYEFSCLITFGYVAHEHTVYWAHQQVERQEHRILCLHLVPYTANSYKTCPRMLHLLLVLFLSFCHGDCQFYSFWWLWNAHKIQ